VGLRREEVILKEQLVLEDAFNRPGGMAGMRRIGGLDISFFKNDPVRALAALVVLDAGSLDIVYEEYKWIDLSGPYIPTFLGFREATPFVELLDNCRVNAPDVYPDVVLCDGNGLMHPRGFGLACHVGVRTNTPSIGVAKKLLEVDGITKVHVATMREKLLKRGDYELLRGVSGAIWGAVCACNSISSSQELSFLKHF
jgi:endonuclease V